MIKRTLFLSFAMMILLSGSLLAQNLLKHIPENSTFVVTFNPGVLNSKVKFSKLKEYDFFKMGMDELAKEMGPAADQIKALIDDPSSGGMDLMASSYMFGEIGDQGNAVSFIMKLSDVNKFNAMVKSQMPPEMVEQKSGYSQIAMGHDAFFTWTDNMAFFTGVEVPRDYDEEWEKHEAIEKKKATDWVAKVMKGSGSIASNPKFRQANQKQHDASLFMDFEMFMNLYGEMMDEYQDDEMAMINNMMKSMYEGTFMNVGLDFDKGAVKISSQTYMNEDVMKVARAAVDAKFNKKFHKYVPAENLMGYLYYNINVENTVEGYKDLLMPMASSIPMYGNMVDDALGILDIFIDEEAIYDLWKGDLMFAVTGLREFEKTIKTYDFDEDFNRIEVERQSKETLPEFVMMFSYGNKENLMKFVRLGQKSSFVESEGAYFTIDVPEMPMDIYLALHDGICFITNNNDLVQNRLKSGYSRKQRMSKDQCKMIKENASIFYWDIPKTINAASILGVPMNGPEGQMVNVSKDSFKSIVWKTPKEIGSSVDQEFSLNFVNKEMNSLEQIFNYINEMMVMMMGSNSM